MAFTKSISVLTAFFAAHTIGTAARGAAIEAPKDPITEFNSILSSRLRMGISVNTASKMDGLGFKNGGVTLANGDASTENTPALDFVWAARLYEGPETTKFDWFVGLTIERERSISSINMKAVGSGLPIATITITGTDRPTFHANLISAGVRWTPNTTFYVPLGFNYGFRSATSGGTANNFNLDPVVGLMVGGGLRVSPNFEIEAVYKIVRYELTIRPTTFTAGGPEVAGTAELAGLTVGARYIF